MVSRKVVSVLLAAYLVAMLAEQAQGFLPIFTISESMRMQEKMRNNAMKKSVRSEEGDVADLSSYENLQEDEIIKLTAPVEFGLRLSARQMEKYRVALEGLVQEMLPEHQNVDG
ncbi:promotilin-like [Ambystoma mexicanum]|uniref:promotilin-like n=1 Tax=Ambystoma mexicanum TaxID=8296 RepID=UPI0037E99604